MDNTTVLCTVCDKPLQNGNSIRTVHTKGLTTFIKNSKAREDNKWKLWDGKLSYEFHESCVKAYSRSRLAFRPRKNPKLKQSPELDVPPFSSSTLSASFSDIDPMILAHSDFDFKNLCLFCGKNWDRAHKVGHVIRNGYLRDRILEIADRNNTDIALILKQRLRGADLVAVEARYHKKCYDSFINPPTAAQKIYVLY
ncbi:unnamed protein product [Euphydryas editha]|uniref:Uncharacterized protein n=1 Tax=Euphydryas editha TaxID=104508 RepID=A0AAU9UNS5_EUPED|nr:unnamed protein product [Euphydryas editha]